MAKLIAHITASVASISATNMFLGVASDYAAPIVVR